MRTLRCSVRLLTLVCVVALCLPANPLLPVRLSASADTAVAPAVEGVARLPSADSGLSSAILHPPPDIEPAVPGPVAQGGHVPDEVASVPGVTAGWWASVQEQIRKDAYTVSSEAAEDGAPTIRGHNLAHNFELTLDPEGLRLSSREGVDGASRAGGFKGEPWAWGLRFTGLGYEEQIQPVRATAEVTSDGNRVEFQRSGVTEWYINDDFGLKQGFTISSAPTASTAGSLILEMALDTDLHPLLSGDAQTIDFALSSGNVVVLRYSELYVNDATGRELPAHLALPQGAEEAIQIVIDDAGATYPLVVDPLVASPPAWTAVGQSTGDEFGLDLGTAGDVNGDGYDDVIVGARYFDSGTGKVYVYFGSAAGLGMSPWTRTGGYAGQLFGDAVGAAGDVNGDGYDDIVVGAYLSDTEAGRAYVYHGQEGGLSGPFWTESGTFFGDWFGIAVGTAGDVNGDGYDDIIVGAGRVNSATGAAYVFYGSALGINTTGKWSDGGETSNDWFGEAVGTAGDLNGDGYDDVVVGASGHNGTAGKVYIYHGSSAGLSWAPTYALSGEDTHHHFGRSVGTAGDVNGDGYDDLAVGAWGYDEPGSFTDQNRGKAYVFHGSPAGAGGAPAWTFTGEHLSDDLGWSVGTAGDVNGDGYDDLVVGAYRFDGLIGPNSGKAYLFQGSTEGLGDAPTWTETGENWDDWFGRSSGAAGDVNGDGYDDLIVASYAKDSFRGKAYVYYGSEDRWTATGQVASESFGASLGTAGDVNGDGYSDVVVGAPGYDGSIGKVYVYHGSTTGLPKSAAWFVSGEAADDAFGQSVGAAGDVNGDGYDDLIVGATGYGGTAGRVYVWHGSASGLEGAVAWHTSGENAGDAFGSVVGTAGDLNGDGYADVVISAHGFPLGNDHGKVYVYHGGSAGLPTGQADWAEIGESGGDSFGYDAGTAGDLNGDGYDDIVVGIPGWVGDWGMARLYYGSEVGLDASSLLEGENSGDRFAAAVGLAGDVDGDGYSDLIVGAPSHNDETGKAYVYHGSVTGPAGPPDWSHAAGGFNVRWGAALGTAGDLNGDGYADVIIGRPGSLNSRGFVSIIEGSPTGLSWARVSARQGEDQGDLFGAVVGTAGDVNGDGYADVIVGAQGYDGSDAANMGKAYLYLGTAASPGDVPPFTPVGEDSLNSFGYAAGIAGDVNGDGYADVYVSSWGHDGERGKVYVYHGSANGLDAVPAWAETGENAFDWYGEAVGTAGDMNGDGYADLVVGAYQYDAGLGKVYLYYGSSSGLATGPAGWTATGEDPGDAFGVSVGTAGDMNGDGYADLAVGALWYGGSTGKVYVYNGGATGPTTGAADWTATGETISTAFGHSLGTAGDVNGDGYADLIVGAHDYWYDGKVYVYYGGTTGQDTRSADWSDAGEPIGNRFGYAVGTAGDVNGDGYADLIVGDPDYDGSTGKAYIYHGSAYGPQAPLSEMKGEDSQHSFGDAVGTAGDVNGDGYADVIVGARGYGFATGKAYVYFGSENGVDPVAAWTDTGENAGDYYAVSVGTAGDVDGDGYADLIAGAPGHNGGTGKAYVYQSNDGGGRGVLARQARGDGSSVPVQAWGVSHTSDGFLVSMLATHPLGRGGTRLQVQACPPGVPFGDGSCADHTSDTWVEAIGAAGAALNETFGYLNTGTLFRWRARALYDSPLVIQGPWRRFLGQAMEADLRNSVPGCDLVIDKAITPALPVLGEQVTYTLSFHTAGGPALGVVITDIIPSDISNVTIDNRGPAITDTGASPGYVWTVRDLAPDEGGVITITGVAESTRFLNTATIGTTSPDVDPTNNVSVVQTHIPGVVFVDADAAGPVHDGLSWRTAYAELQDALSAASAGDEIWAAEGEYRPTGGSRASSFQLVDGVAIYGGFDGTEIWRHERDWDAHATILSGDIGTLGNNSDNAFHVITATNVVSSTVLDGLIISGGKADGDGLDSLGGGIYNDGGSPTLFNITFSGNSADKGGGIYNTGVASPTLTGVAFSGNSAGSDGGAMFNTAGSSPRITNVTFSTNWAAGSGGALYNDDANPTLVNCILWGNTAVISGSQIYDGGASTSLVSYSDIEDGWTGTGNISEAPAFYDADGLDDTAGTLDDDLRLRHTSPVIDLGDNGAVPQDDYDLDGDGLFAEPLPLDLSARSRLIGFTDAAPTVDMGAFEANILDVIADADALYELGLSFRLDEIQLLPADTKVDALQNYEDFNDGDLFYDFCADYDQIGADGYCPDEPERKNVRNTLLDAIELYVVALGWPTTDWTTHDGQLIPVRAVGGSGVVAGTHEIANVHLIFGNEFLVDAIDYRFSTAGIPYADEIIAKELGELTEAQRQFELTMDMLLRALGSGGWDVGPYFSEHDFEVSGVACSRMMITLEERAARYLMIGDKQAALDVYDQAYEQVYLLLKVLAQSAGDAGTEYLRNGSWEMFNNLSQMRDRAQAIRDGLDFFGFAADYVPLQSYSQLMILTEGPTGNTGLLSTARDLEDQARDAQRTFDTNASDMATELHKMTASYTNKLFDICGPGEDTDGDGWADYPPCGGGLIEKNLLSLDESVQRLDLAWMRAQNIAEKIQIEQEKTEEIIRVKLGLVHEVTAIDLAIAKLNAYKETHTQVTASEHLVHIGVSLSGEFYEQVEVKASAGAKLDAGVEAKVGFKIAAKVDEGYKYSQKWVNTATKAWTPNVLLIGQHQSIKALKAAEAGAEITGASSAATIRNLLLQESEALLNYEIAMTQFDKLVAEHNFLAQKLSRTLNKRAKARDKIAKFNSHLLSPAYRIERDTLTIQSAEALGLAAQFAYLTARAAEYELLTPYPGLGQIYKARTSNDIRLFLDDLAVWYQALDRPGQLNRYPYTISIAKDVLGLTDDYLDPTGRMDTDQLDQLRYERFQDFLWDYLNEDQLEFWFITSLDQQLAEGQYLFSPNIWNNRIAGIGTPMAQNEGVGLNIVTRQTGDVGSPEVVLTHDGQTAYRNAADKIVHYNPDTAVPVGYVLPDELDPENTTVVLRPAINGAGAIPNGGLINLSVAASWWTLRIPAGSKGNLDFSQIEDFVIHMDTTGRALPALLQQAEQDALNLQAGLQMDPVSSERISQMAGSRQGEPLPELSYPTSQADNDGIGGSYYGSVVITSPVPVIVQVLDMDLENQAGTLSGSVNISKTVLYGAVGVHGITDGDTFSLTSDVMTMEVLGRTVQRKFMLEGDVLADGDILRATYTDVITNLLAGPVIERGRFSASRLDTAGGDSLAVWAADRRLPGLGSTAVTVTLRDTLLQPIAESARITLTCESGTFTPSTVDTVDGVAVVSFKAGTTPGEAIIFATTGEVTGTARVEIERGSSWRLWLPTIVNGPVRPGPAPDLVVDGTTVTSTTVQVVIRNQGNAPVPPDNSFWVDLYVNPTSAPTAVNQLWDSVSTEGVVWGVPADGLNLDPGSIITLTYSTAAGAPNLYYLDALSNFTGTLAVDTPIYVQVDSWNPDTDHGAVLENHEIMGWTYNNILGPVPSTLGDWDPNQGQALPPETGDDLPPPGDGLPPRP